MADNWTKLLWRLKACANNKANGGSRGAAAIYITVFMSRGNPLCWHSPKRVPIEPKEINIRQLPHKYQGNWAAIMESLPGDAATGIVERVMLVENGQPVGWLDTT